MKLKNTGGKFQEMLKYYQCHSTITLKVRRTQNEIPKKL